MGEEIILYTPNDLQTIFKCGRKRAYEIMHLSGFPSFSIGNSLYVESNELRQWIQRNRNKTIIV